MTTERSNAGKRVFRYEDMLWGMRLQVAALERDSLGSKATWKNTGAVPHAERVAKGWLTIVPAKGKGVAPVTLSALQGGRVPKIPGDKGGPEGDCS